MPSLELASGYHPDMSYDIHMDINPHCPHLEYVGNANDLPWPNDYFDEIRAADIIEHFSYRHTIPVLKEWYRVLKPEGKIYIQCPNSKLIVEHWLAGDLSIVDKEYWKMPIDYSASYWICGGQEDNVFAKKGDDFRYNAHYTLLSPESLKFYLEKVKFINIDIQSDGGSNLVCWAYK